MENVVGITRVKDKVLEDLQCLNYVVEWRRISAEHLGALQSRFSPKVEASLITLLGLF
jgi:site-specific DNA-cytosine methylase